MRSAIIFALFLLLSDSLPAATLVKNGRATAVVALPSEPEFRFPVALNRKVPKRSIQARF